MNTCPFSLIQFQYKHTSEIQNMNNLYSKNDPVPQTLCHVTLQYYTEQCATAACALFSTLISTVVYGLLLSLKVESHGLQSVPRAREQFRSSDTGQELNRVSLRSRDTFYLDLFRSTTYTYLYFLHLQQSKENVKDTVLGKASSCVRQVGYLFR